MTQNIGKSSSIEDINTCHLANLSINIKDCIRRFNYLWVLDYLDFMIIRDMLNEIATSHVSYQETVGLEA